MEEAKIRMEEEAVLMEFAKIVVFALFVRRKENEDGKFVDRERKLYYERTLKTRMRKRKRNDVEKKR